MRPILKRALLAASRNNQTPRALLLLCGLLGAGVVVAWLAPVPKPEAFLGRFNYVQFCLLAFFTTGAFSVFLLGLLPAARRRAVGFRVCAVWLGLILVLGALEGAAWLLPSRHQMDNPWYFAAGGGIAESDELPFERPAHLRWEGLSRGDLALLNGDADPYARTIQFATDRDGFRNHEEILQADLITIGDSYTEAGNVLESENFCTLLGERLGIATRNLGRAGYSAPSELIVLKKYGLACQPEIVIWQVAESNDLDEALRYQAWVNQGRPPFFDFAWVSDRDRLNAWRQRSLTYRAFDLVRDNPTRPWPFAGRFRDGQDREHPVRFLRTSGLEKPALGHPGWPVVTKALSEGDELCRSQRAQLLVVLVPLKYRVLGPFSELPGAVAAKARSAAGLPRPAALGALLKAFCHSRGIPFVDATAALQERAAAGELVYQPFDTHLSPAGHEVLAELVGSKLEEIASRSKVPDRR